MKKEVTSIDKNGEEITKNVSYVLQFIHTARFMASSLSNLDNNLSEGIHKIKYKDVHNDKICKSCGITYNIWDCFLDYKNFKDGLIEYKYCSKNYQQKFEEKWKEQFLNIKKYSNHDNNKFILLLWKDVYLYQYIDDWEKFNETSLS